jgi:hypothetical protein
MKKVIVLWIVLMLFVPLATVLAADNNETAYYEVNMLLNKSKTLSDVQLNMLTDLSSDLSSMQRSMIFESNKQSPTVPFVLNFLVGFGIGSYVQGDSTGGTIALVGDLVSIGLFYGGYAQALNAAYYSSSYTGTEGAGMMVVGAIGMLATRVFELIRPFSFASDYNKKLSNALMNVSMVPVVDQNNDMRMKLAANIKF